MYSLATLGSKLGHDVRGRGVAVGVTLTQGQAALADVETEGP
jgi:hypothetical protein